MEPSAENFAGPKKGPALKTAPPPALPPEPLPPKNAAEETGGDLEAKRAFIMTELHVRSCLGLNKEEVRSLRREHLVEGEHWVLHRKRIVYSAEGAQQLREVLGVSGLAKTAGGSPGAIAAEPEPVKEVLVPLVVYRTGLRNGRIILAHKKGADPEEPRNRLRVRVRRNGNLVKGMEIPCRQLPGYEDLFELAHALPRRRGVW